MIMNKKLTVTISRQFGSGGHEIGELLSKKLGVSFIDREIIAETAKKSGLSEELIQAFDEKPTKSFLYSLVLGLNREKPENDEYDLPLPQQIFLAERNTIQAISEEKSAVFVGRCADYALRDIPGRIRVFIYAPFETRVRRIMERRNIDEDKAADLIHKIDTQRSNYYNYYTGQRWGQPENYDLCIDSNLYGISGTVDIMNYIICELSV